MPNASDNAIDLINGLLRLDPKKRLTSKEALEHPYFKEKPLKYTPNILKDLQKYDLIANIENQKLKPE